MAQVSPNLGLSIWNLVSDLYNHDQQADNMAKIDFHDHAPGRGIQIPTEGIKDGAITALKMAPGANSIQDGSITPSKFATMPAAKVYNSVASSCISGVETTLLFDSERFDNNNIHDTGVNTERLVVSTPGLYMITMSIESNVPPTTGLIRSSIYKNGIVNSLARSSMSPNAIGHTLTTFARLAQSDYVMARVLNTTGATINVVIGSATSENLNDFGLVWLAP